MIDWYHENNKDVQSLNLLVSRVQVDPDLLILQTQSLNSEPYTLLPKNHLNVAPAPRRGHSSPQAIQIRFGDSTSRLFISIFPKKSNQFP